MLKGLQGNAARCALCGFGKHQLAQLGEGRGEQAQSAITHQQRDRHHQHRLRVAGLEAHGVDQLFEQQRHAHVGQLGPHHEAERMTTRHLYCQR
jgi:hypothetical protein